MKSKKQLLEQLKSNGGYIIFDDMPAMIKHFGENFVVVIKFYEGEREMKTLEELYKLETTNEEYSSNIKNVFISSDVYDKLFPAVVKEYEKKTLEVRKGLKDNNPYKLK